MRPLVSSLALALCIGSPAAAQDEPPEREETLVVYGDDPCPQSADPDEVVVCARRPEEERYRIPEPLRRDRQPTAPSWTSQVEALEDAQRDSRPDSCSVVGDHGQSGCTQELIRRWRQERRQRPDP